MGKSSALLEETSFSYLQKHKSIKKDEPNSDQKYININVLQMEYKNYR